MSDLTFLMLLIWGAVTILGWFVGGGAYNDALTYDDRRYFARMILAAPFWPVALTYLILRYAPSMTGRVIARLMYDATRGN